MVSQTLHQRGHALIFALISQESLTTFVTSYENLAVTRQGISNENDHELNKFTSGLPLIRI